MPTEKPKRKFLVIGGDNLGKGQRTFYERKDGGGITAPFGLRLPAGEALNEDDLLKRGLAHFEDE